MNELQADYIIKALLDGVEKTEELAERSGVSETELAAHRETLDRGISLIKGFYRFACENMKPVGLPPPPNPYRNRDASIEDQSPEYFAFEAVQRENIDHAKAVWICGQLGLDEATAKTAIDNVSIPWRETNGWRSYARQESTGQLVLMDKAPMKIKRHLTRLHDSLLTDA